MEETLREEAAPPAAAEADLGRGEALYGLAMRLRAKLLSTTAAAAGAAIGCCWC